MAGITQKSFETLFPLWSLKKTVVGYIDLEQKETYKKLKIEVDIVSDTGILIMLLLVITKMIILLLVLLLLLLTTNESNNCNNYNNNDVLIIEIIITIKM